MANVSVLTTVVDGLPIDKKAQIQVTHDGTQILIEEVKLRLFKKPEVLNTYRINFENVLETIVATQQEIEEKNRSVIGRGAVGLLLFGPMGAILGGMSGLKTKKVKKEAEYYMVIAYRNKDDEIANITFDVNSKLILPTARVFVQEVNKIVSRMPNKNIGMDVEL